MQVQEETARKYDKEMAAKKAKNDEDPALEEAKASPEELRDEDVVQQVAAPEVPDNTGNVDDGAAATAPSEPVCPPKGKPTLSKKKSKQAALDDAAALTEASKLAKLEEKELKLRANAACDLLGPLVRRKRMACDKEHDMRAVPLYSWKPVTCFRCCAPPTVGSAYALCAKCDLWVCAKCVETYAGHTGGCETGCVCQNCTSRETEDDAVPNEAAQ